MPSPSSRSAADLQPLRLAGPEGGAKDSAEAEDGGEMALSPAGAAACGAAATHSWNAADSAPVGGHITTVCINLASIMERVDEQLLPALYRHVGASFSATPQQLGVLTFSRAVVQALASPLAGLLGHFVDRAWVIAAGAALWGACCLGFATTDSISQAIPFWAANGIGLALLIPAAQSLIADLHLAEHRGRAFGMLHLTGAVGALIGTLVGTNLGHTRPLGIRGWRVAFGAVALASWMIGVAALCLARDPRTQRRRLAGTSHKGPDWRAALRDMGGVLCLPSFLIIVLQGIVGTTPWLALVFATLWFQLLGFSDWQASLLMAAFLAANAAGGLLGGFLGDWAARRWPDHGRITVCQLSVSAGVPLSVVLFKGLPHQPSPGVGVLYAAVLVITGLTITWAATACNNPIFAEIVPPHSRNLIYAFDRSFEGAVAACAAPLVGWLAQTAFAFSGTAEVGIDLEENQRRASALGSALLVFTAIPWTLCAIFFSGLHFTYPRDRARAARAAAAEAAELAAAMEREAALELATWGLDEEGLSEGGFTEEDKQGLLGGGRGGGGGTGLSDSTAQLH